ncbi:hypothetical protein ILYODFUR_027424 [Ilyodon furcidens]|uniref:Uncharacterized protein n=1 Tax=Ilyodon furcidens TaxID=33524 RepID=A0ABV0V7J1_9TELE
MYSFCKTAHLQRHSCTEANCEIGSFQPLHELPRGLPRGEQPGLVLALSSPYERSPGAHGRFSPCVHRPSHTLSLGCFEL